MKISIIIPVYNEEKRILSLLNSVVGKVDEVVVIDKASTDNTKVVIHDNYCENIKVVSVPYSEKGKDDFSAYCKYTTNEWVMVFVASEQVPISFWDVLNRVLEQHCFDKFDLIMIPRLYYCFGLNVPNSPWDVSYFPFMFNKNRIVFNNVLHSHFSVKDERNKFFISCDRESMIQHFTHTTISSYILSVLNYSTIEVEQVEKDGVDLALKTWYQNIYKGYVKLRNSSGQGALAHYAAWNIYWSINILKLLESKGNLSSKRSCDDILKLKNSPKESNSNIKYLLIPITTKLLFHTKNIMFKYFYKNTSLLRLWTRVRYVFKL